MAVRKPIDDYYGIFFITITCAHWIDLFAQTDNWKTVYKWFDYLKSNGHYINAYVVMPNHLHALIGFTNTGGVPINRIIGNGKRFMAYEIINYLRQEKNERLLGILSDLVSKPDRRKGKLHEVFEASFDWKEYYTQKFLRQKIDYIHENPCRGKWNLAPQPSLYPHSSAGYYLNGVQGEYVVVNYARLEDVDLSIPRYRE